MCQRQIKRECVINKSKAKEQVKNYFTGFNARKKGGGKYIVGKNKEKKLFKCIKSEKINKKAINL